MKRPDYSTLPPLDCTDSGIIELSRIASTNLAVSASLRATAWALAEAGLRTFRPELSEEQVQDEVRAQFRRASG